MSGNYCKAMVSSTRRLSKDGAARLCIPLLADWEHSSCD